MLFAAFFYGFHFLGRNRRTSYAKSFQSDWSIQLHIAKKLEAARNFENFCSCKILVLIFFIFLFLHWSWEIEDFPFTLSFRRILVWSREFSSLVSRNPGVTVWISPAVRTFRIARVPKLEPSTRRFCQGSYIRAERSAGRATARDLRVPRAARRLNISSVRGSPAVDLSAARKASRNVFAKRTIVSTEFLVMALEMASYDILGWVVKAGWSYRPRFSI